MGGGGELSKLEERGVQSSSTKLGRRKLLT